MLIEAIWKATAKNEVMREEEKKESPPFRTAAAAAQTLITKSSSVTCRSRWEEERDWARIIYIHSVDWNSSKRNFKWGATRRVRHPEICISQMNGAMIIHLKCKGKSTVITPLRNGKMDLYHPLLFLHNPISSSSECKTTKNDACMRLIFIEKRYLSPLPPPPARC